MKIQYTSLEKFVKSLQYNFEQEKEYYSEYPYQWIFDSLSDFQHNYIEIGEIWYHIQLIIEKYNFEFNLKAEGENIFEELTASVIFQLFRKENIICGSNGEYFIDLSQINEIMMEMEELDANWNGKYYE